MGAWETEWGQRVAVVVIIIVLYESMIEPDGLDWSCWV